MHKRWLPLILAAAALVSGAKPPHSADNSTQPVALRNRSALIPTALRGIRPRLEMTTELFLIPATPPAAVVVPSRPLTPPTPSADIPVRNRTILPPPSLRTEPWVFPLMVTSTLTMLLIAGFEVFVLFKAWRTSPSRRHLFLGQMLLLGLFMAAALAGLVCLTPTTATCALLRFGSGVSFALVFASLLVKTVFLISLNSGVYLPAPYQGLLLLFAVLIQIVLGVQWLFNSPPRIELRTEELPPRRRLIQLVTAEDLTPLAVCQTPFSELLLSFIYIVFLIAFVAVLAVKSRGIRDNYREATYIGLSIGCIIPLWMAWSVTGLILPDRHRDACLGFGLVSTAAVTFLIMFMPKGRQLAAMGKDGIYLEDRDDRFSSLTPAGSGYSPSFFHLKPVKYGLMGEPASSPTTHKTGLTAIPSIGAVIKEARYVPQLAANLLSVSKFVDNGYMVVFNKRGCCVYDADSCSLRGRPVITASRDNGIYKLDVKDEPRKSERIAPTYTRMYHYYPPVYPAFYPPRYTGPDADTGTYKTQVPTVSSTSNPNVFFSTNAVHPGLMY